MEKDYDELWYAYGIQFNAKLEDLNDGDWSKLDEIEQEIAALWKLVVDVYGGGFDDFFLNWGYDCYTYAMRGIRRVAEGNSAAEEVYELFEMTYTKVFARFENDDRISEYADIINYLTEEDKEILEQTFDEFDQELGPMFCEAAFAYYFETLKKKP